MFHIDETQQALIMTFSSTMRRVDQALRHTQEFLDSHGITDANVATVLRELLVNAVEHGNKMAEEKQVACTIELNNLQTVIVTVADQGPGFDPAELLIAMPKDPHQQRHRGLPLVNALCDHIAFSDNGRRVTATLTPEAPLQFDIRQESDRFVVTPSGNLTAQHADLFRHTLLELLDRGAKDFIFDLRKVANLDSISLSILVSLHRTITETGAHAARPVILNPTPAIRRLFNVTKTDQLFEISARSDSTASGTTPSPL